MRWKLTVRVCFHELDAFLGEGRVLFELSFFRPRETYARSTRMGLPDTSTTCSRLSCHLHSWRYCCFCCRGCAAARPGDAAPFRRCAGAVAANPHARKKGCTSPCFLSVDGGSEFLPGGERLRDPVRVHSIARGSRRSCEVRPFTDSEGWVWMQHLL